MKINSMGGRRSPVLAIFVSRPISGRNTSAVCNDLRFRVARILVAALRTAFYA